MIHPSTRLGFIDEDVGYGVFATELIPRGTFTWILDPLDCRVPAKVSDRLVLALRASLERYAYQDSHGHWVLPWDLGRFVNHSCDPNSVGGGDDAFEIAVRDILPGEQLTDDYAEFGCFRPFPCRCGAVRCVGRARRLTEDDWEERRGLLGEALRRAQSVPQPLRTLALRHAHLAPWLG